MAISQQPLQHDLSWDEAHIEYWCEFDRNPNIYHSGFWRLLQAPYLKKMVLQESQTFSSKIEGATSLEWLLEQPFNKEADRILRRYGLYCGTCSKISTETIGQAALRHGLAEVQTANLLKELQFIQE